MLNRPAKQSIAIAALSIIAAAVPLKLLAHHGANNNPEMYLSENMVHLEGEISHIFWRNPHPRLMLAVVDEQGQEQEFELELSGSINSYAQAGIGADLVAVGDSVKAAGVASRRDPFMIGLQNLLLPDGQEMLSGRYPALWSDEILDTTRRGPSAAEIRAAEASADGLFRVWGRRTGPRPSPSEYSHLFTDESKALVAEYDFAFDNPELNCQSGLASNMFDPTPMQIIDNGDQIIIYTEEYDLKRTIYMTEDHPEPVPSNLGFSTGYWDGDSLIVHTSLIDWPNFDPYGTPQSLEMTYVETFWVAEDDSRLNYRIIANDPVTLTGPIELERAWLWQPGTKMVPFDCAAEVVR